MRCIWKVPWLLILTPSFFVLVQSAEAPDRDQALAAIKKFGGTLEFDPKFPGRVLSVNY